MPNLKVAHLRVQGQDMVVAPLESAFARQTATERDKIIFEIQAASASAGLRGIVVPVWNNGGGKMGFIAPPKWHPYFKSIGLSFVFANLNKQLSC